MKDHIPFDILAQIFDHYGQEESLHHPLETLLLVCRTWNEAASSHRSLWGRIKIAVCHFRSINVWKIRLPLRLKRAGPTTPLHIDIRNEWMTGETRNPTCMLCTRTAICYKEACQVISCFLDTLAGPAGEYCQRWVTIYLALGVMINYHTSPSINDGLSLGALLYPTPSLTRLTIRSLYLDDSGRIFPSCPALEKVTLQNCFLASLPDLSVARAISIKWANHSHRRIGDLSALEEAVNLENVRVMLERPDINLYLPRRLPFLTHLAIRGYGPMNLLSIQAPKLNAITLYAYSYRVIRTLCQCDSILLAQIETLDISIVDADHELLYSFMRSLLQFMKGLTYIRAGHSALINIVRLLKEDNIPHNSSIRLLGGKEVVLSNYRKEARIPIGVEERTLAIEKIIKAWHLTLGP